MGAFKKILTGRTPAWVQSCTTYAIRGAMSSPLILPMDTAASLARAGARAFATSRLNKKKFPRALDNLRDAYPEWHDDQVREHAIAAYEHLFQLGIEILYAPRRISDDGLMRYLSISGIAATARDLLDAGPTILITGHCGNWELIGCAVATLGFPVHAVYRPLDLKPLDRWMRETRQRLGLTLVPKFGAMHQLADALRSGHPVGLVADQNGGDKGLFVPFFGRLTSTYKSIGLLALRHNAKIVCGMARRLRPGETDPDAPAGAQPAPRNFHESGPSMRYRAEIVDMFGPEDWNTHPDPLFYLTARYRRALEHMVRRAPEQYLWMHRIWRSRAPHEAAGKPFPAALKEKLRLLPWMTDAELARIQERSEKDKALHLAHSPAQPSAAA